MEEPAASGPPPDDASRAQLEKRSGERSRLSREQLAQNGVALAAVVATVFLGSLQLKAAQEGIEKQLAAGQEALSVQIEADREARRETAELAHETETRSLRRPIYKAFRDAANAWSVAQERRALECVPGTDRPRTRDQECTVTYLGGLQSARYDFRRAANDMYLYATRRSALAVRVVVATLPDAGVYRPGPTEGPEDKRFSEALGSFIDVTACDTNPSPDLNCSGVDESLTRLANQLGVTEDNLYRGDGEEATVTPPQP